VVEEQRGRTSRKWEGERQSDQYERQAWCSGDENDSGEDKEGGFGEFGGLAGVVGKREILRIIRHANK